MGIKTDLETLKIFNWFIIISINDAEHALAKQTVK